MENTSALKSILESLCSEQFSAGAIVSRNGIPVVWSLPGTSVETFATLSATILGAADVVLGSMAAGSSTRIRAAGADGELIVAPLDKRTLLVLYSKQTLAEADISSAIQRVQEAG